MTTTLAASPSAVAWHEAIHATLAIAQGFQVKRASIVLLETSDGRVQVDRSTDLDDARTAASLTHATMTYLVAPGLAARDAGRAPGDARDRDAAWTLAMGVAEGDRTRAEQALAVAETSARALVAIHQGWIARVAEALDRQRTLTHDEIVALRPDEPQTTGDTMTTEAYAQVRERLEVAPEQLTTDDIETLAAHDPADRAFALKRRAAARYELETKAAVDGTASFRDAVPVDIHAIDPAPGRRHVDRGRLHGSQRGDITRSVSRHFNALIAAPLTDADEPFAAVLRDIRAHPGHVLAALVAFVHQMNERNQARNARLDALEARPAPRGETGPDEWRGLEERLARLEARPKGMTYCGTFKRYERYAKGDVVTHDGSAWVVVDETASGPPPAHGWQLCVKRGADGRNAEPRP